MCLFYLKACLLLLLLLSLLLLFFVFVRCGHNGERKKNGKIKMRNKIKGMCWNRTQRERFYYLKHSFVKFLLFFLIGLAIVPGCFNGNLWSLKLYDLCLKASYLKFTLPHTMTTTATTSTMMTLTLTAVHICHHHHHNLNQAIYPSVFQVVNLKLKLKSPATKTTTTTISTTTII